MTRSTRTFATLTGLALAATAALGGSPASAEAVVYDQHTVRSLPPGAPAATAEHASVDIPTGYDRDRRNWHKVSFVETHGAGRVITVDLDPWANTLERFEAQRDAFAAKHGDAYRELSFTVVDDELQAARLFRARWTYTVTTPGTDEPAPFVTVYLKGGNRLKVVGALEDAEHLRFIRRHVVRSLSFPG